MPRQLFPRIWHWGAKAAELLVGQAAILVLQFAGGILIVHLLSVEEYAFYTIANALVIVGALGANLAQSQALISLGVRVREDPLRLGTLFETARRQSGWFFAATVPVIIVLALACSGAMVRVYLMRSLL